MKRLSCLLTLLLISALLCKGGEVLSASPPLPDQTGKITRTIGEADLAFNHSDYAQAMDILKRSLLESPQSSALWNRYKRVLLAKAGNEYLLTVPEDRYRISAQCLVNDLQQKGNNYFLLDIRQPEEFAKGHLDGAINIPLGQVVSHLDRLPKPQTGKVVLIISRNQHRANHVLVILRELGYTNAYSLRNGYDAYLSWLGSSKNETGANDSCLKEVGNQSHKEESQTTAVLSAGTSKIMSEAYKCFADNNFRQARILIKQALIMAPSLAELWTEYNRAVLAMAGNDYLKEVPKDGYQINTDTFGMDYRKGPGLGNFFLLDVREPDEFVMSHIGGSINIPFRTLLQHIDLLPKPDSGKVLLLICRSQHRAIHDLVVLRELGYTNAFTLQGGYDAYQRWLKNLPSKEEKGKRSVKPPSDTPSNKHDEENFSC